MLVKYEIEKHKTRIEAKEKEIAPTIEATFDPYKMIEKTNNHKKPSTPNFRLMSSRPTNRVLPSYMTVKYFYINIFLIKIEYKFKRRKRNDIR